MTAGGNASGAVLKVAMLEVRPGEEAAFEAAFAEAPAIISSISGYIQHSLQRRIEPPGRYLLLVEWEILEDHTIGFRDSLEYQRWKALLHHFYEPFPVVEHFERVDLAPTGPRSGPAPA